MLILWTIGHSNQPIEAFVALLRSSGIEAIADVRRFPGSRRLPQYGAQPLAAALAREHIEYEWLPALGGRRRALPDSPNTVWRNLSFRGYADHMAGEGFAQGLVDLIAMAAAMRTAMMCSEALWWRCHRALVADAAEACGIAVFHILPGGKTVRHPMTAPARISGGELVYGDGVPEATA